MDGLSPADLLAVWERGATEDPVDRALTILATCMPGVSRSSLYDLPVGERDERLLAVRERTFGPHIRAMTSCDGCGERVELQFLTSDVSRTTGEAAPVEMPMEFPPVRPLTSHDLAIAARCKDADRARMVLAARCLVAAGEESHNLAAMSADALALIARGLEQLDPGAVRVLEVICPACHACWESDFDVADFLWTEIEAASLRLLRDVHALARAYGWQERDILAMSALRRGAYLELVQ